MKIIAAEQKPRKQPLLPFHPKRRPAQTCAKLKRKLPDQNLIIYQS
jgi:hypothetical protein